MSWKIVRRTDLSGAVTPIAPPHRAYGRPAARNYRAALTLVARWLYEPEGRPWEYVAEPRALFGGYVRAKDASGEWSETLEIQ